MCLDNEIFEVQQFLTNIDVWNNENISYILRNMISLPVLTNMAYLVIRIR